MKARAELSTKRPVLRELRASSQKYKQMIEILEDIEKLNAVPEKLEQQISQKHFMSAHKTLSDAIETVNKESLLQIPALQGIRSYLQSQEVDLYSVLIEELHNHIYLKSPYTSNRWHSYQQGIDDFGTYEQVLEEKIRFDLSEKSSSFSETSQLDSFLNDFNKDKPFVELQDENAESNSYYYIWLLIETLGRLNKLPSAFETLLQRLPSELHRLVDKTITEVSQRFPKNLGMQVSKTSYMIFDTGINAGDNRIAALRDLIWTLYSKFIAVLQAHRIVYEVSKKLWSAQQKNGLSGYDFLRVFQSIRNEIKDLLGSYVGDGSKSKNRPNDPRGSNSSVVSAATTQQLSKTKYTLDKVTRKRPSNLFKFSNLDVSEIKSSYDQLQATFEKSVPGLVASSRASKQTSSSNDGAFDPYLPADVVVAHKLLVPPNVFNISVMLEPTVQFIQKASIIFPPNMPKPGDSFIENFLVSNYVPELKDTLTGVFERVVIGQNGGSGNGPLDDVNLHWVKFSKLPVLDGVVKFYDFVRRTCYLLNTSSVYREHYVNLILSCVKTFTDLCNTQFARKVSYQVSSANESKIMTKRKLGAAWALDPTVRQLLKNNDYNDDNNVEGQPKSPSYNSNTNSPMSNRPSSPAQQEIQFYLSKRAAQKAKNASPIGKNDLLSISTVHSLAMLATSIRWLVIKLRQLQRVVDEDEGSVAHALSSQSSKSSNNRSRPASPSSPVSPHAQENASDISIQLRKRWILAEPLKQVEDVLSSTGLFGMGSVANSSNSSLVPGEGSTESNGDSGSNGGDSKNGNNPVDGVALTLAGKSIKLFEEDMLVLEELSSNCVLTLKGDLRARALYYIDRTMLQGKYYLSGDTEDRDEYIGALDSEVTKVDGIAVETMLQSDRNLLLGGFARFLDQLLISSADGLPFINEFGIKKMYRNIVVLQQMLKSIAESPQYVDFSRSLEFYKTVELTTLQVLELARKREITKLTHDEVKTVLKLIRSRAERKFELMGRRDKVAFERNGYHDDLVKLHDLYWGSEKVQVDN